MEIKYVQCNTLKQAGSGSIIGATSIVLTSLTDIYGNVLTMTDFGTGGYGSCEPDTNNEESFTFTGVTANANGTYTLTGVKTALAKSPYTETSGLIRQHSGGTSIVISDTASFWNTFVNKNNNETITGYFTIPTPISAGHAANKGYVDGIAIAGAPDATTTTKGISKMSVAPVSAASPIAVGDNDGRVPTQAENDALVGDNTDIAVGTGNKFITQTGLQHNAEKYAADAGANDTYTITLSPVPTSYTNGMVVHFKANTINTGAATLNVNSLGAKTIVKYLSTTLSDGDIVAGMLCTVIYNGTNFVLQNPVANVPTPVYKVGALTKSASDASTTQNIAHGLGNTPKFVRLSLFSDVSGVTAVSAQAVYNGTTAEYTSFRRTGVSTYVTDTTFILNTSANADTQQGVVTYDATNIIITWTKTGSPGGSYQGFWEATT